MGQSPSFDDGHDVGGRSSTTGSSPWLFGAPCCQDAGDDSSVNFTRTRVVQVCCTSCEGDNTNGPLVVQQSWISGVSSEDRSTSLHRSNLLRPHATIRFQDYYRLGRKVGEGSFGDVFESFTLPVSEATGLPCGHDEGDAAAGSSTEVRTARRTAVKVFSLVKPLRAGAGDGAITTSNPEQEKRQQAKKIASFEEEYRILSTLEHPHIVRMHESFQESETLYIVLELCRGGELYARLVQQVQEGGGGGFSEPLCRAFFKQMLQAVSYLHSNFIVHRDLKTENFLLFGEPGTPEYDIVKLCDFGTSTRLSDERPRSMEHAGTLSYTAPEVYCDKGAALPADVWSMGVILYVLVTGSNPFRMPGQACNRKETISRIKAGDFERRRPAWMSASPVAQDLVQRHLVLKETRRLSCKQSLAHPFILGNTPHGSALHPASGPRISSPRTGIDPPFLSPRQQFSPRAASPTMIAQQIERGRLASLAPKALRLLLRIPRLALEQRLALAVCALASLECDIKGLDIWRGLFLALDKDQDGRLSFQELVEGMRGLVGTEFERVTDEHILACAWALDFDQSGAIEWLEWLAVALMDSPGVSQTPEPLGTAFRLVKNAHSGLNGLVAMVPATDAFSQMIAQWSDPNEGSQAAAFGPGELRSVMRSIEAYAQL